MKKHGIKHRGVVGGGFARKIVLGALAVGLFAALGCPGETDSKAQGEKGGTKAGPPAVPVVMGVVTQQTVPIKVGDIGYVEPNATVGVKAQVGGVLMKVNVTRGQEVKAGDVLFEIDPRPLQAALNQSKAELDRQSALKTQAEANKARDAVQLQNANAEVERNRALFNQGVISKSEFEKLGTSAGSLEASVNADEAAISSAEQSIIAARAQIDAAQLQLSFCTLSAPIDGRLGDILVDQGNLIKANPDDPLVVIHQIHPVQVGFSLPERYLDEIRKHMKDGALPVTAVVGADTEHPAEGKLTFIDNQVDRSTGTIKLKATFQNEDGRLWPEQYVNVSVTLYQIQNAVLAPSRAISTGQKGQYAFVLGAEQTARVRQVVTGEALDDLVVVKEGLKPGERVVLDGQLTLRDGMRVSEKKDLTEGKMPPDDSATTTSTNASGTGGRP